MADLASRGVQPPAQQKIDRLVEFSVIARSGRKYERARRAESQWRKRSAAIASGRFCGVDGFTNEEALDAFAPHGSEAIEDRLFTDNMERSELEAWSLVELARRKGRTEYLDACGAYLRLVERMDRAAERRLTLKPLTLGGIGKSSLQTLTLGAMRHRSGT